MSRPRLALYRTDAQGRCVWVNDRLCELFEMERREALDLGWTRRIHPEDVERVRALRLKAVGPIATFQVGYRIQLPVGGTRWIEAFSTALLQGTTFVGRSGMLRDVTPARRSAAEPVLPGGYKDATFLH